MILFDNVLINKFNQEMFDTLLYKHNLTHLTPKLYEYLDDANQNPELPAGHEDGTKGYLLLKDNKKYMLPKINSYQEDNLDKLPVRIGSTMELVTKQKEVVQFLHPDFKSFKVKPEHIIGYSDLVNCDGITSQDMDTWVLLKVIRNVAYCRRINCVISGVRGSGKTSAFESLGLLTDKGYVVKQPRSVMGLSYGLRRDGYIVLDEIGGLDSEARRTISNYLFQQGERSTYYKTGKGASLAQGLAHKYDISGQSCIVVTNLYEDYLLTDEDQGHIDLKHKDKFFQYMFSNSQAINNRFLPLRITSPDLPLTRELRDQEQLYIDVEQFATGNPQLTEDVKRKYINIMKSLEWYTSNWDDLVDYQFVESEAGKNTKVKKRHYPSYKEILAGVYLLAKQTDWSLFEHYRNLLNKWVQWYYDALYKYSDKSVNRTEGNQAKAFEEYVK